MIRKRITHLVVATTILVCRAALCLAQSITIAPKPSPAPARWRGLIGEYGPDDNILIILESDGKLVALFNRKESEPLDEVARNVFKVHQGTHAGRRIIFVRDSHGRARQVSIDMQVLQRRQIEPESGNQLHVKPVRPVPELMKEALAAQPPQENGD